MKKHIESFLLRFSSDQNGQTLIVSAVLMMCVLGMAGLVADVGDVYYNYNQLLSSTNAAALAGAGGLSTSGAQATANAALYSSQSGDNNAYGNLAITSYSSTLGCVTGTVATGVACVETGSTPAKANAIQVTQTAKVKTYFAAVLGTPYVSLTATATALMGSPNTTAQNIAVIIDTTHSMQDEDTTCGESRLTCALAGIQTFLQGLHPCTTDGCGTLSNGNYQNSLDRVSLFTFPELSNTAQQVYDTNCSGTNPSITPYTFPSPTATSYTPGQNGQAAPTYQITSFASNYQTLTTGLLSGLLNDIGSGLLNDSSGVVDAVGGDPGCAAMSDPGGEGTYYAGVLYAAQASLLAEQAANPGSQNAIIIVSDGAATSAQSQMSSTATASGTYPSYVSECEQAVTAADNVKAAGTTIYSVGYGSPSTGCTTDTGVYSSPCYTMQQMATPASNGKTYFYSDQGGIGDCPSGAAPSSLSGIFGAILSDFGPARLVPNSTFPSS
jgi:Flp pilus assembly protein TadG